jgi:hypothetical protein
VYGGGAEVYVVFDVGVYVVLEGVYVVLDVEGVYVVLDVVGVYVDEYVEVG